MFAKNRDIHNIHNIHNIHDVDTLKACLYRGLK